MKKLFYHFVVFSILIIGSSCLSIASNDSKQNKDDIDFSPVIGGAEWMDAACAKKVQSVKNCSSKSILDKTIEENLSPDCYEKFKNKKFPNTNDSCYNEIKSISQIWTTKLEKCVYDQLDTECKHQFVKAKQRMNEVYNRCASATNEVVQKCNSVIKEKQEKCLIEGKDVIRAACEK